MLRIPRWAPWAAAAGSVALLASTRRRAKRRRRVTTRPTDPTKAPDDAPDEPDDVDPGDVDPGDKPQPIAVGLPSDPGVAALLAEMDELFESYGVDTALMNAREVTRMPKAPDQSSAIPPRLYWDRMAKTLRDVIMPLRLDMQIPFELRGYRAPDYNAAVGGKPGSRHQWFEGVDIYLVGPKNTAANRRLLGLKGAQIYLSQGDALQVGFGAYGAPTPSNIHLGTGHNKRNWREADHYIAKAKAVA